MTMGAFSRLFKYEGVTVEATWLTLKIGLAKGKNCKKTEQDRNCKTHSIDFAFAKKAFFCTVTG
jgi:hypothetical protein